MLNEADTRAKLIDPKLQRSGWTEKMVETVFKPGDLNIIVL